MDAEPGCPLVVEAGDPVAALEPVLGAGEDREAFVDVAVDRGELRRGVSVAKVVPPTTDDVVDVLDRPLQRQPRAPAVRPLADLGPDLGHRPRGRPLEQIEAAVLPRFPHPDGGSRESRTPRRLRRAARSWSSRAKDAARASRGPPPPARGPSRPARGWRRGRRGHLHSEPAPPTAAPRPATPDRARAGRCLRAAARAATPAGCPLRSRTRSRPRTPRPEASPAAASTSADPRPGARSER